MTGDNLVELENVIRVYGSPPVRALDGINLTISRGEILAIIGPSGSGKSTLMNVLGTLDQPTSGQVTIDGVDTQRLSDPQLSRFRSHLIGFVFQHFHLSDGMSALENVADGLLYSGIPRKERRSRAGQVLDRVGLGQRQRHHPNQMSGGERQRVAIARALIGEPPLLLADEPTGNLDSASGDSVIDLLRELNGTGTTIVIITHDRDLAARVPRNVSMKDGRIISDLIHA